jgi:hypothetical protein
MTISIDFGSIANINPWPGDAQFVESNPASLQVLTGRLELINQSTTNIITPVAAVGLIRSIEVDFDAVDYPSVTGGIRLYIDNGAVPAYLQFETNGGDNQRLQLRVLNRANVNLVTGLLDNSLSPRGIMSISGVPNGANYDVTVVYRGVTYLSTITNYTPGGTVAAWQSRPANFRMVRFHTLQMSGMATGPDYTQRKSSTFTANHTLGTVPNSATVNGLAVTISGATTTTVSVTLDAAITTSGEYNLVIADSVAVTTQTQTVQVNVFGVVPSNNPAQKDGSALASLTSVQIRITDGANLNGTEVYYSPTQTTDASGNFNTLDVSPSAAAAADPVRMQVLTAAGDSITSTEAVELI